MTLWNHKTWLVAGGAALMMACMQSGQAAMQSQVAPKPTAPRPVVENAAPKQPTATLTGCLREDGDHFALTNLSGTQAPKGRSWKTGFIKKSAKNVEVVGASSNVRLKDQIGHQVTIVGMKDDDTHIKASSVKRLNGACS